MRSIILALLLLPLFANSQTDKETVTNETVISLQKAGLGSDIIKEKIQSASAVSFDLSTTALIALKKAGVPNDVISVMLSKKGAVAPLAKPTAPVSLKRSTLSSLSTGLYWYDTDARTYNELDPSILTNSKSGGLGEAIKRSMISGLINAKQRASLSGNQASFLLHTQTPIFVFVFDVSAKQGLKDNGYFSVAESPREFFLVKLTVVKNTREIVVGKSNTVSQDIGIDDAVKIPFTTTKMQDGIYQVGPEKPLEPGEYAFMYAASSQTQGMTHKLYDFSIGK